MNAALAIAAAEIRQHRIVFWAGLLLGFLPLLVYYLVEGVPARPFEPGRPHGDADALIWLTAVNLSLAIAIGLGSSVVSRDLSERRLGFYLARPLTLLQYWSGKLGAAYLLAAAAALLALLPAHALGSMRLSATLDALARNGHRLLLGLALALAAASVAGGAFRARSGLLLFDVVMLPLTWAGAWWALSAAFQSGTGDVVMLYAMPWLMPAATLVLLAASALQVCAGRLELRRGHLLLSAVAWGGLWLFFIGGILATIRTVSSATPADVRLTYASYAAGGAGGNLLLDSVSARWGVRYQPGFLLDAKGAFVRLQGLHGLTSLNGFAWSRDGRTFAWSREAPFRTPDDPSAWEPPLAGGPGLQASVHVARLDSPGPAPRSFWRPNTAGVRALAPDGRRMLVELRTRKEVLDSERGVAVARLDGEHDQWIHAGFLSDGTVRALRVGGAPAGLAFEGPSGERAGLRGPATVVDWDVASGRVTERGTISLQGDRARSARLLPLGDWERVLRFDPSGLFLHDLDGRLLATLVDGWPARANRAAGSLSAGRYGCILEEPGGLRLRVFGADGRKLLDTSLPGRFPLRVGGETSHGLLALGVGPLGDEAQRATLFVDLESGSVVRREPALSPAIRRWELGALSGPNDPEPGSFATRVFLADEGLVSLDPATGKRTLLVAPRGGLQD